MIVKFDDLEKIRKQNQDKKIVLGIGTFDLFHFEHLRFLQDAKKLGDILCVAVKDNFLVRFKHPSRPIIDEQQRLEIVDSLKCVDYAILCDKKLYEKTQKEKDFDLDEKNNNWLYSFYEVFEKLRPDVLYHEDTTYLNPARELVSKNFGVNLIERKRTGIVTTTKLIEKIKSTN